MTEPSNEPVALRFFPVSGTWVAVADPALYGHENIPEVERVSGLVTFTPRLYLGETLWLEHFIVTEAYDSLQTVTKINNPNSGLWTLNLLGTWTTDLPWDITNSALQAALITAAGASAGDITVVTGLNPQSYDVQFANGLGGTDIPTMVADPGTLMNSLGQTCAVSVAPTDLGTPQIIAPTAISIPPLTARIWDGILSTINTEDTEGFALVSSMPEFGRPYQGQLGEEVEWRLIYDVSFDKVTFNGAPRVLAPWAFKAPVDQTPVCLTDPALERLAYQEPIPYMWAPETHVAPHLRVVGDWRTRASEQQRAARPRRAG
jgi:hypothetical protein